MEEINPLLKHATGVYKEKREYLQEVDRLEKYKDTIMRLKPRIKETRAEMYFWERKVESLIERIMELDRL